VSASPLLRAPSILGERPEKDGDPYSGRESRAGAVHGPGGNERKLPF